MKCQVCALSLFVLLAFSTVIAQQDGPKQDGPKDDNPLPEAQVLGPQLIAWSEMQEPKPLQQSPSQAPTPEPRPETAPPQQPTPSTQPAHLALPSRRARISTRSQPPRLLLVLSVKRAILTC
jgi:hypothetical protein